jgi:hypothetical protein
MHCYTCQTDEQHRQLGEDEKVWLRNRIGRNKVDEFWVCTATGCRNLRTGMNKRPFDITIRLPEPD